MGWCCLQGPQQGSQGQVGEEAWQRSSLLPPALPWAAGDQRSRTRDKLLLLLSSGQELVALTHPCTQARAACDVFKGEHLAVQGFFKNLL